MSNRNKKIAIIATCFLVWLFFVMTGEVHYTVNDDLHMNLIAAGAYGPDTQYLIHINILLGLLIKGLYGIFPYVNCYLWFFLLMNYFGMVVMVLLFSQRLCTYQAVALSIGTVIFLSNDLLIDLQYTKNAVWYTIIGGCLLLTCLIQEKQSRIRMTLAVYFMIIGFATRPQSAALVLPFLGMAFAIVPRYDNTKIRAACRIVLPSVIAVLLTLGIHHFAYTRTADWINYRGFNRVSTEMRDFGRYSFADNKDDFIRAGYTETDYLLLDHLIFADTERFTAEWIYGIETIGSQNRAKQGNVFNYLLPAVNAMKEAVFSRPLSLVSALILLAFFIFGAGRGRVLTGVFLLIILAEYCYMTFLNRPAWRAGYAAWISPALIVSSVLFDKINTVFPEQRTGDDRNTWKRVLTQYGASCIVISVLLFAMVSEALSGTVFRQEERESDPVIAYVYDDTEHFYLAGYNHYWTGLCGAETIFLIDKRCAGLYHNVCLAGSWQIPSPIGLYYARMHEITNPVRQLTDSNMYFIGTGEEAGYLLEYLNEKNELEVFAAPVKEFDEVTIWDFYEGVWTDGKMQRVS